MPARVVPPAASLGEGEARPLDLEDRLRLAAEGASGGTLDSDALEALACTVCEAVEGSPEGLRAAVEAAVDEVLPGSEVREAVLQAVLQVAESESSAGALPAVPLKAPKSSQPQRPEIPAEAPKFLRRAQVESLRVAEYMKGKQARDKRTREEEEERREELAAYFGGKVDPAEDAEDAEGAGAGAGEDSDTSDSEAGEDATEKGHREEIKSRLRELGQPATLFGESDAVRLVRLKHFELTTDQNDLAGGSVNLMQVLDRRAEREVASMLGVSKGLPSAHPSKGNMLTIPDRSPDAGAGGDDEDGNDGLMYGNDDDLMDWDQAAEAVDDAEEIVDADTKMVVVWLRNTLRAWETSLQEQAVAAPNSARYKTEKAQFRQTKQYLRPLRKNLYAGSINNAVVGSLARIAAHSTKHEHMKANEAYMRLAIGNAPWPMGVTAVTFHDRANRRKIQEGANAHVLDDETTRKYIQMTKRLLSFAEARWPN